MGESFEHLIRNQGSMLDNGAEIWDFMPASGLNLDVRATLGQHGTTKRGRELAAGNARIAETKLTHRSRVSNGSATFLDGVDGRSVLARRYRDILAQLTADIGGDPSEAQSLICRRAATLAVWCETAEADLAKGAPLDIGAFTTAANSLRRLLQDIGIERRARNVTPSLGEYLASKAQAK